MKHYLERDYAFRLWRCRYCGWKISMEDRQALKYELSELEAECPARRETPSALDNPSG